MALYALGDLHLAFQRPDKTMDIFGGVWKNHERKAKEKIDRLVRPNDTLVLTGDHSWGKNLDQCREDLQYICALPGRKILLRGNHDMFWDAKKTERLNKEYEGKLYFLQNNYYSYEDYALVGTKGFTFEGPFYLNKRGRVIGWDQEKAKAAEKLVNRECKRLRTSFEAAKADGYQKFIMFLHYPPTNILELDSPFTEMAEEYGADQVIYSHCHGTARFHDSILGEHNGILYRLVSGDYLDFEPVRIL
ncbi:MAG: metallophosphoesterase [Lachnospiraceae bacterium]|nr:metallophosphoesterase [Lachnospiraceae bacterium]